METKTIKTPTTYFDLHFMLLGKRVLRNSKPIPRPLLFEQIQRREINIYQIMHQRDGFEIINISGWNDGKMVKKQTRV